MHSPPSSPTTMKDSTVTPTRFTDFLAFMLFKLVDAPSYYPGCLHVFHALDASQPYSNCAPLMELQKQYQITRQFIYSLIASFPCAIPIPVLLNSLYFAMKLSQQHDLVPCSLHYVFGVLFMISTKYAMDEPRLCIETWSRILDIPVDYLRQYELSVLEKLDWNVHMDNHTYQQWAATMKQYGLAYDALYDKK